MAIFNGPTKKKDEPLIRVILWCFSSPPDVSKKPLASAQRPLLNAIKRRVRERLRKPQGETPLLGHYNTFHVLFGLADLALDDLFKDPTYTPNQSGMMLISQDFPGLIFGSSTSFIRAVHLTFCLVWIIIDCLTHVASNKTNGKTYRSNPILATIHTCYSLHLVARVGFIPILLVSQISR